MNRTALIQVLGAVAYGEKKAHDMAQLRAEAADDPDERKAWRTIAAEELRHHKGFVRRLQALEADPQRAMAPYQASLDHYHGLPPEHDEVAAAVCDVLGEGLATDLLTWLREVVDAPTAAFIDSVLADEAGHEARAVAAVRAMLESQPHGRRRAAAGARRMVARMAGSSPGSGPSFLAFLQVGRPHVLVGALVSGYLRRLGAIGVGPFAVTDRLASVAGRMGAGR